MSLDSWKEEFYKVPADNVREEDAVEHSITKWIGLRPENLSKHELVASSNTIYGNSECMAIDAGTCALCEFNSPDGELNCDACSLSIARGGVSCDGDFVNEEIYKPGNDPDEEGISPYQSFLKNQDPEPMIFWLQKAKEYEKNLD